MPLFKTLFKATSPTCCTFSCTISLAPSLATIAPNLANLVWRGAATIFPKFLLTPAALPEALISCLNKFAVEFFPVPLNILSISPVLGFIGVVKANNAAIPKLASLAIASDSSMLIPASSAAVLA